MNRIVFVFTQSLDPTAGGVQRSTWKMGHFLARNGWEVFFVSLTANGHQNPRLGKLICPSKTIKVGKLGQGSGELRRFLFAKIPEINPDVVVNQNGVHAEPARTLAGLKNRGSPFTLLTYFRNNPAQIRENQPHILRHLWRTWPRLLRIVDRPMFWKALLGLHRARNRIRFKRALDRCDRFVVLSPTFVDELRWYVSELPEGKVIVIPNAFEPSVPEAQATKKNWLLYVGRIENAQKNALLLPELWERLYPSLPSWELHIVGDGPDKSEAERRFSVTKAPRVHFHGRQAPDGFYRQAKIFLMLSAYEGFGNTLIEAQGFGVVPVAFRSYSAIDWILNHRKDSVLVEPFDLERFATEIERLANDERKWATLSAAAVENTKRFSENIIGKKWITLFNELRLENK